MAIAAQEFYTIGERLHHGLLIPESAKSECTARTVAGRIYYAAYLATRETLRSLRRNADYDPGHDQLIQFLRTYATIPAAQRIGERLDDLKKQRTVADYSTNATLPSRAVGALMLQAKYILDHQADLKGLDPERFPIHKGGK